MKAKRDFPGGSNLEGPISRRRALKLILAAAAGGLLAACARLEEGERTAPEATRTPLRLTAAASPAWTPGPDVTATPLPPEATPLPGGPAPHGTVEAYDPLVRAGEAQFGGADGALLMSYLALPAGEGPFPAVLVCHDARGLTPHIQDFTRRLARAGFTALALDLLSREGGSAAFIHKNPREALESQDSEQQLADFRSGWEFLHVIPEVAPERLGMTGFGFGGGLTWLAAARMPELRAAVPFYGPPPSPKEAGKITAAVLAIYGERDRRGNAGLEEAEAALPGGGVYEKALIPGAGQEFFNDASERYDPQAAAVAWRHMLDWFGKYLA